MLIYKYKYAITILHSHHLSSLPEIQIVKSGVGVRFIYSEIDIFLILKNMFLKDYMYFHPHCSIKKVTEKVINRVCLFLLVSQTSCTVKKIIVLQIFLIDNM